MINGSRTITASETIGRPENLWTLAEREAVCTCGLIAAGYRGSWAISHSGSCPVSAAWKRLCAQRGQTK
jgi:hypothetical protein